MNTFSKQELDRYSRHITLPDFGIEGQKKLKSGSVLVIGAGGLGSPVLLYLAAAGVGKIGIVDDDVIDETNLQRQVIYGFEDIGKKKVIVAQERIKSINPHIQVKIYPYRLTIENALELIGSYDIIADGTDNFSTRYLVNDACVILGKINVFASIYRFEGQISVFNFPLGDDKRSNNYRDIFPQAPSDEDAPNCQDGGVLGVLPGMIGSMQANEVIKLLAGIGEPLVNRLFIFDALAFKTNEIKLNTQETSHYIKELGSYESYCITEIVKKEKMQLKELSVQELKAMLDNQEDFKFIDVREKREFDFVNIGAELIPLAKVLENGEAFDYPEDKKVVVHCRSGKRSADAILVLQEKYGYANLYNLKGGIIAYATEIDTTLPTY